MKGAGQRKRRRGRWLSDPFSITQPCTAQKAGPRQVWLERERRCLVIGQLEAGAWNVFTLLND